MSGYSARVLADSPALYWTLDQNTGATDQSGNARNGTAVGGVTIGGYPGGPFLDGSTSTDLDGTDDVITSTYQPFTAGSARTFMGWANRDSQAQYMMLFAGHDGAGAESPRFYVGPSPTETRVFWEPDQGGTTVTWDAWPGLNRWVHWALVFDETANTAALYINGALVSSQSATANYVATTSTLDIGASPFFNWDGKVAAVTVFANARTATQIATYYAAGAPGTTAIRELPPLRLSVNVTPPGGQPQRWGRDERRPENVPSGISFSSTAPGGFEAFSCTLPRRPETAYSDLERLSNVVVRGVGGVAWEGRLDASPRVSGTNMAVSPSAVGWQAHLEDDQSASMIYVDRNLGNWGEASRAFQIALQALNLPIIGTVEVLPDVTTLIPCLRLGVDGTWAAPVIPTADTWYDAGAGNLIGSVYYDFAGDANTAFQLAWSSSTADNAVTESSADLFTASTGSGTATPSTPRRFWEWRWNYNATPAGTAGTQFRVDLRYLTVWGNHGLSKRGTAAGGADGLYASDVIAHAVRAWAPRLRASTGANGTIAQTAFIIPHLEFRDRTTAAEIISGANRFQIQDWMVWEGQNDGEPTFYLYPRGARGRAWQARVGPSQLSEAGPSVERLFNGAIVRYADVDGTSKTVGPTGSGCDTTSAFCTDADPTNPANKAGVRRWTILEMQGVSTPAGTTEVGRQFLAQTRLLNASGQATITGYCTDDRGIVRPAWQIRAGDTIQFVDAADTSSRRIVKSSYNADTGTCSIDLDAPPDGLAALLERLQVVLVPLGL